MSRGFPRRVRWRAPVIQATGRLRLADRLSSGALSCSGLCRSGVRTKFGIDMVLLGEPGTTRSSKEGCTGPGRKRSSLLNKEDKRLGPLYYSGCTTASIHRRDPTTERHGGFDLLRFRPGPVHPSLDDLVVPGSPRSTISIPNLVRTPDRHSPLQLRAPELKRSSASASRYLDYRRAPPHPATITELTRTFQAGLRDVIKLVRLPEMMWVLAAEQP
ncbi:hypothetical protein WMY93_018481 [Mugilogobius chulae]|uniref:Uncharacterized protein n=1 Tax=Mugilogobius chulae TaxID=88201 RepID=A0AAW0NUC1_9GOBI